MIVPNRFVKHWTETSKYCYKRGCNCNGCYVKSIIEEPCMMKSAVFSLVKKFGAPKDKEKQPAEKYTAEQKRIIELVRNGIGQRKKLAKELNISLPLLTNKMMKLYRIAEADGFEFLTLKFMFYEWVEYIRSKDNESLYV